MSADVKISMAKMGVVLGVILTLVPIAIYFASIIGLPTRLAAAEQSIRSLEYEQKQSRELLIRIDENVKALKEAGKK